MTELIKPLCVAPWTNILIDTNKGMKPCCAYMDEHLGNIRQQSVLEILSGDKWTNLKNKLKNQEWVPGCYKGCKAQEDNHSWSPRLNFQMDRFQHGQHEYDDIVNYESNEILYMEFNGSNVCNLACLHCNPIFSSKWVPEWEKLYPESAGKYKNTLPNTELIKSQLKQLDLTKLRFVHFKGGDPMFNDETLTVLEHLDELGIISNIRFTMFSNGTIINEKVIELLKKAKYFVFSVSIDGTGKLNEYIRYGDSSIENIIKTVEKINTISNVEITISVSTMVYNIFNLVEIRDFWLEITKKYKIEQYPYFNIVVTEPVFLNPCVLSDSVRQELIKHYTHHQLREEFEPVLRALANPYLGDDIHNEWVNYTRKIEAMRGNRIEDIVPQLANELVLR